MQIGEQSEDMSFLGTMANADESSTRKRYSQLVSIAGPVLSDMSPGTKRCDPFQIQWVSGTAV